MGSNTAPAIRPLSGAWWSNFWFYYKRYILFGGIALLCLIVFLAECIFTVNPDFSVSYFGGVMPIGQVQAYMLEDALAPAVPDINRDGRQVAQVNLFYLESTNKTGDAGQMFQMADLEVAAGDAVVYLFDEQYLERYSEYGFYDLTEWAQEYGIAQSALKRYPDGRVYAVNLAGNPVFTAIEDMEPAAMYLAVRPRRENEKSKKQTANYENGLHMARYLLSGGAGAQ